MSFRISADRDRFKQILKGKVRDNLRKYISNENLIGRKGDELVSIPIPRIDTPRFLYDDKQAGGAGEGDGEAGDPISGSGKKGPGSGKGAGQEPGERVLEVEITLDELADMLGEELALPKIEPKGKAKIPSQTSKYTSIRKIGPESLRNFKRTYKEALKRSIASGTYTPGQTIIPIKDDKRYRSRKETTEEAVQAVIIYMMDVSGSMSDREKSIIRTEVFWIDTWLQRHYKGVETVFIIHDIEAREVERDEFFRIRESGGTLISSAYDLCAQTIKSDYPSDQWNTYVFHFSDGDVYDSNDTTLSLDLISRILPHVNLFGYGQITSQYGSGSFLNEVQSEFKNEPKVITSNISDKEEIPKSIKEFLGKGI